MAVVYVKFCKAMMVGPVLGQYSSEERSLDSSRPPLLWCHPASGLRPMSLESLKLLETKIGEFVDEHERVRQQHETLQQRVKEMEKKLADAMSQLKQHEQERSEIRSRLERILSRLEGLELA